MLSGLSSLIQPARPDGPNSEIDEFYGAVVICAGVTVPPVIQ